VELGGDVGGSIRIPAAFCGVYGHKPTYNLVPKRGPSLARVPAEISVRGPMARDPEDLRLVLQCIAGPDRASVGGGWRLDLPQPAKACLADYSFAVWADDPHCRVHDDVRQAALALADALEARGAAVDRRARPDFDPDENLKAYTELTAADAVLESREADVSLLQYKLAQQKQAEIRESWGRFFQGFDVLICPSHCVPAFPHTQGPRSGRTLELTIDGVRKTMPYWKALWWATLTNVALLPSTTFPCGLGATTQLPVGLNVVGPEWTDLITIDVARLIKVELGLGFVAPPAPFGSPAPQSGLARAKL